MQVIQWTAIFTAALLAFINQPQTRLLALGCIILGYSLAIANGQLGLTAMIAIALLGIAALAVSGHNRLWQYAGHTLFILLAIALATHTLPGFQNHKVFDAVRLTADATPFTMYLNLDKPLIGFWLLLVLRGIHAWQGVRRFISTTITALLVTACVCMTLAYGLGMIVWAPKFPAESWLWILNNLLLVCFAEEVFFRGYLQTGISRILKHSRNKDALAISMTAMLFGIAHIAGGWQWVIVAGIAGVGYGIAYRYGGLLAAIVTHFGLNTVHFFLLTYPMLTPQS